MQLLQQYGTMGPTVANVRLVVGNTAQGVEKYYTGTHYNGQPREQTTEEQEQEQEEPWEKQMIEQEAPLRIHIYVGQLPELLDITIHENNSNAGGGSATFGAAVTLNEVRSTLSGLLKTHPLNTNLKPLVRHLGLVAHDQVRDVGSWAGNIMIAKHHPLFPSDVLTMMAAAGATVSVATAPAPGTTEMTLADFVSTYTLKGTDLLYSLTVPFNNIGRTLLINSTGLYRSGAHYAACHLAFLPVLTMRHAILPFYQLQALTVRMVAPPTSVVVASPTVPTISMPTALWRRWYSTPPRL
jgi:hypothetical protein